MPNVRELSAEAIKEALYHIHHKGLDPVEEMIAVGEAVFHILQWADIEPSLRDTLYQLEKQFGFYALLAEGG